VNTGKPQRAYIITGPTSGIGRAMALELAKHGTLILVGRDRRKLDEMQRIIEQKGQQAVSVVCDLADLASVRRAAAEIITLNLHYILPLLAPFIKYWSSPKRAAGVATKILLNESGQTGIYYDDGGLPMVGSSLGRNPKFTDRVVAETRAFLSNAPT
jgi:NAD(P)-dependent dehydrogenase (short-subunit alcohol dehydrogenase family)